MKNLNNILLEKFIINKNTEIVNYKKDIHNKIIEIINDIMIIDYGYAKTDYSIGNFKDYIIITSNFFSDANKTRINKTEGDVILSRIKYKLKSRKIYCNYEINNTYIKIIPD